MDKQIVLGRENNAHFEDPWLQEVSPLSLKSFKVRLAWQSSYTISYVAIAIDMHLLKQLTCSYG